MTPPLPVLEKPRRTFGVWRAILLLLLLPLGASLLYVGLRAAQFRQAASRLPQERAAARREGIPLTPADLRRNPPVPPSQNAAPLYREIAAAFNRKGEMNADEKAIDLLKSSAPPRTDANRAAARQVLARRKPLLALAKRAAALPHCDFQRPYQEGAVMKLPELASMRQMARLLAARALLESDAGQPEKALRTVATGARIAAHAGEDPTMIHALVQIAIRTIMNRAFHEVLSAHSDRPGIIALAEKTEAAFNPPPNLRHSLGAEVVMGTVICEQMRTGTLPKADDEEDTTNGLPKRSPKWMTDAWESNMLSSWRESFARLDKAGNDPMAQYRALRGTEERFDRQSKKVMNILAAILMPVFDNAALTLVREDAERRLRKTAVALVAYRQKAGRYPERLDLLPTPPPADPFTQKPLVYRRKADGGFLLYSVGMNFKDDGGRAKPSRRSGPDDTDIVVEYAP